MKTRRKIQARSQGPGETTVLEIETKVPGKTIFIAFVGEQSSISPDQELWFNSYQELSRAEIRELIRRLRYWLRTGRLKIDKETR